VGPARSARQRKRPAPIQAGQGLARGDLTGRWAVGNAALEQLRQSHGAFPHDGWDVQTVIAHVGSARAGSGPGEHAHPYLELTGVRSGTLRFTVAGDEVAVEAGAWFCCAPGTVHRWQAESASEYCGFMLHCFIDDRQAAALRAALRRLGHRLPARPLEQHSLEALHAAIDARPLLVQRAGIAMRQLLSALLGRLQDQVAPSHGDARDSEPAAVTRALRLIRDHVGSPLGVAEIAQRIGISSRHLNRQFHAAGLASVQQIIDATRLDRARSLLLDSDEPISHIAQACGCSDASHFARWFRKQSGLTPSMFRQSGA